VVHEKIGVYDKVVTGQHHALALGKQIDLRIFPKMWAHGFAVEKSDGETVRRSLQFFDAAGDAVHKVHLRPASNLAAYEALVAKMRIDDQSQTIVPGRVEVDLPANDDPAAAAAKLRERWGRMTDVHQFFGMLKALKLSRHQAVSIVGAEHAWQLGDGLVEEMMRRAVAEELPIMCFVGNAGCIQIHSGPVRETRMMGPWLNVMDPDFHLHLRTDHVDQAWAVRKPTKDGIVTSIEGYDADRRLIVQFFGVREEGKPENPEWAALVAGLPRMQQSSAA
jgi:putative hemin transport protein